MTRLLLEVLGSHGGAAEVGRYLGLVEEKLYLGNLMLVAGTTRHLVCGIIIATHDLVL